MCVSDSRDVKVCPMQCICCVCCVGELLASYFVIGDVCVVCGLGIIFGPRRTGPDHTLNRTVRKMAESV